jgi:hypothetical protein
MPLTKLPREEFAKRMRSRLADPAFAVWSPVLGRCDSVGAESLRRSLSDWLTELELVSAGKMAELEGYEESFPSSA